MKGIIINVVAFLVIGVGASHLSGVQSAKAASNQFTTAATCSCEGEEGDNSTCSGDKCACSGGQCKSCDNRLLGLIKCKI